MTPETVAITVEALDEARRSHGYTHVLRRRYPNGHADYTRFRSKAAATRAANAERLYAAEAAVREHRASSIRKSGQ